MKAALLLLSLFAVSYAGTVQQTLGTNDIKVLNYALTLEHLENAFYKTFLARYDLQAFLDAGYTAESYAYFILISAHEESHVNSLRSVITSLGGTPVQNCTYTFSTVTNVASFVSLARVLENTGVSAYDGAISAIQSDVYKTVAATIATVEARHAAYLNQLNGVVPFPDAFDIPRNVSDIVAAVTPFLSNCPQTVDVPYVLDCLTAAIITDFSLPKVTIPSKGDPNFNLTGETREQRLLENDVLTLNYALTLENLENEYYKLYLGRFTADNFTAAGYNASVYPYLQLIGNHEQAHVDTLSKIIKDFGGIAAPACTYNFPTINNVSDFLAFSRVLENTGVSAYNGAINTIFYNALKTAAATITTVEARHAAYLNGLTGMVPFPNVTDIPLTPTQVVAVVGPLLNCPYTLRLPQVLGCGTNFISSSGAAATSATGTSGTGTTATSAAGTGSSSAAGATSNLSSRSGSNANSNNNQDSSSSTLVFGAVMVAALLFV